MFLKNFSQIFCHNSVFDEDNHFWNSYSCTNYLIVENCYQTIDFVAHFHQSLCLIGVTDVLLTKLLQNTLDLVIFRRSFHQKMLCVVQKLHKRKGSEFENEIIGVFKNNDDKNQKILITFMSKALNIDVAFDIIEVNSDELIPLFQKLHNLYILNLFKFFHHQLFNCNVKLLRQI